MAVVLLPAQEIDLLKYMIQFIQVFLLNSNNKYFKKILLF